MPHGQSQVFLKLQLGSKVPHPTLTLPTSFPSQSNPGLTGEQGMSKATPRLFLLAFSLPTVGELPKPFAQSSHADTAGGGCFESFVQDS